MAELRTTMATAGAALMALGVGLVILAEPVFEEPNNGLRILGWVLVGVGGFWLVVSFIWIAVSVARKPHIVIEGGNSDQFRRRQAAEPRHSPPHAHGYHMIATHVTRLRVRETKRRSAARSVHVRVSKCDPPADSEALPFALQWVNGDDYYDLAPGGRGYVRLCESITNSLGERAHFLSSIPPLAPGEKVAFTVDVLVEGKCRKSAAFMADWSDMESHFPAVRAA
jgi:hypothetical protein